MKTLVKMTAVSVMAGALLGACGQEESGPPPARATDPAPARVVSPQFSSAEAEAAMKRPLDGSSVERFEKGLAQLETTVPPEDFRKVQSALEWMLFYDYSVGGDKAKLYASLDGATPLDIIARSERRKGQ